MINTLWIIPCAGFLISGLFFLFRWFVQMLRHNGDTASLLIIMSNLLSIYAGISALTSPPIPWMRLSGVAALQLALLLVPIIIDTTFRTPHTVVRLRMQLYFIISFVVCLALGVQTFDNVALFTDTDQFRLTPHYVAYFGLSYALICTLFVHISWSYAASLSMIADIAQKTRHIVCQTGFSLGAFAFLVATANLLSLYVWNDFALYPYMNAVYHGAKNLAVILVAIAYVAPGGVFSLLLYPQRRWVRARDTTLLKRLHDYMTPIVPGVRLPVQELAALRVSVEIKDAREVILSQHAQATITPHEEAAHLVALRRAGTVYTSAGPYDLPTTVLASDQHILAVARQLAQHESRM